MGKRKRKSSAEDLLELIARLPWWVAVLLAILSFLILHQVATRQIVNTGRIDQVGSVITKTFWKSMAMVGQYIAPVFSWPVRVYQPGASEGEKSWSRI